MAEIDVGSAATDRGTEWVTGYTSIVNNNPANLSGKITTVEIWSDSNLSNCEVGIFEKTNGAVFTCRDSVVIGTVTAGAKRQFTVDLDVVAGDYIGLYYTAGAVELDYSGAGMWYLDGDYMDCVDQTFSFIANRDISLYGIGAEPAPPAVPRHGFVNFQDPGIV